MRRRGGGVVRYARRALLLGGQLAGLALAGGAAAPALGDESGSSFWTPGTYDSFSAIPNQPGWSVTIYGLHSTGYAGSSISAARLSRIGALDGTQLGDVTSNSGSVTNQINITPSYGFSLPALDASAALSVTGVVGHATATETDTAFGAMGAPNPIPPLSFGDSVTGGGDLSPQATLFWNRGVHNFMVYATGNAPVGAYDKKRLANLGIGHGAVDAGGGYTYSDSVSGVEFSAVAGFTYNLINPTTEYRSGVDFHLDVGASKHLTEHLFVGPVGYLYNQVSCDGGPGDEVGCFRSRVAGLGAQLGYNFPVGPAYQAAVHFKGYGEFATENRAAGWAARATLTISPK
ncbi:SphA family protein [Methylocystis heyeri]|uniref:Phenol degradation protein meta n=1 Tax=Methylocystis heyeri TaxID=391905 RepID=A0A6B8KD48_9HYPH|nr:transporter [Methylocystis heyeri]QGM45607.1 phenol degradation protein meta [Methylocystis heyeri]